MGRGGPALILYLDTSALVKLYVREKGSASVARQLDALVKLYVREKGSASVARQLDAADAVSTSMVAWAEARAAFARLLRERPASGKRHRQRVAQLVRDWERYAVVELTATVAHDAGELAERHGLRGFDAIHLASALWLKSTYPGDLSFMAFDARLTAAAAAAGLAIAA